LLNFFLGGGIRSEMRNAHIFPFLERKRIRTAHPVQTLQDNASGPTTVQPSPDSAEVAAAEKYSLTIGKSLWDERFGTKGPAWIKFFRRGDSGGARTSNDNNTHRRDMKIEIEWPFADEHEETSCTEKADVEQSTPSLGEEGSQAVLWIHGI
jgi:hypothetical protein